MAKFSLEEESEDGIHSPRKRKRTDSHENSQQQQQQQEEEKEEEEEERRGSETSISIDLEVLDCTICFEPLVPPVFQCENGHTACSSCCTKLKNKCHSCFCPIGYRRCLAIEKVIESVRISCRNYSYGCKERIFYTQKTSHEETCLYAPCSCPISGCTFVGSSKQLSLHFCSKHSASAVRFQYNRKFTAAFDKSEPFIVLQSDDDHLFLLNNRKEVIGNAITVSLIGPFSRTGGLPYALVTNNGGRSLVLKSFTMSIQQQTDTSSTEDFLLVPCGFHNCFEQLKMEICIWSSGEMQSRWGSGCSGTCCGWCYEGMQWKAHWLFDS